MKGNLVLFWLEEKVALCYGRDTIVLAAETYPLDYPETLPEIINGFLHANGISAPDIEKILVVADLTVLLQKRLKEDFSFGYFRITPAAFEYPPVNSLLKESSVELHYFNLPLPDHPEYTLQMQLALKSISNLPIKHIAINSTLSLIEPAGEKRLIEEGEKLYPGRFIYYPSYNYSTANFLLRENVLLINLILSEPVELFFSWLSNSFKHCSVSAPIYFLKGDGTLTSSRTVKINPLLTWQSQFASYAMGGSRWTSEGDSIIAAQNGEDICLGLTENYLPKTAGGINSFWGLEIPGKYPITTRLKKRNGHKKWEKTLDKINPFPGTVPIISFVPSISTSPVFRYPLVTIPDEPCVWAVGVLTAPYRMEIEKVVFFSQSYQFQVEKQGLLDIALYQLNREGVHLSDISHRFEELSLRYLPQNAYLLRLTISGNLL